MAALIQTWRISDQSSIVMVLLIGFETHEKVGFGKARSFAQYATQSPTKPCLLAL
jgi:hypothetical protein